MLEHVLEAVDRQVQMHRTQEAALGVVENVAVEDPETHDQANSLLERYVDGVLPLERPNRFPGLVEHEKKEAVQVHRMGPGNGAVSYGGMSAMLIAIKSSTSRSSVLP